ncbi:MAG: hypothetical protein RR060_04435, partial [Victivallaceae bacterium]
MKTLLGKDDGFALVSTILLLMTLAVLTAAAVTISQYGALETTLATDSGKSYFLAENALNQSLYKLLEARKITPGRQLTKIELNAFAADGRIHHLTNNERTVSVQLFDAASGIEISGNQPGERAALLLSNKTSPIRQQAAALINDYCDGDDFRRLYGMESNDYQNRKMWSLPRNRPLQF